MVACAGLALVAMNGAIHADNLKQYPKAAFTFDDSTANGTYVYDLHSDGHGAYANTGQGQDGFGGTIDSEFTLCCSQANVNLNLVKSGRKFNGTFAYAGPGTACPAPCAPLGTYDSSTGTYRGSFGDGWFLTIFGVPGMYNGETRQVQALFTYGGASTLAKYAFPRFTFSWCASDNGSNACNTGYQNSGSLMVLVTRNDVNHVATWVAATDANPAYPLTADLSYAVEQASSSTTIPHGLYHTSFRVIVQCTAGCSALTYPPT
jgi:hypothetical protein